MKVLAIDTATERCSVALRIDDRLIERQVDTHRGHADLILPMIQEVLTAGAMRLADLDGIAFGRGPGAFTGVRIAVSVAQGLGFAAQRPVIGISNLAAVAQQCAAPGKRILVCMDARMAEVYWARFRTAEDGTVIAAGEEQVSAPAALDAHEIDLVVGTGLQAYESLRARFADLEQRAAVLPRAREVAFLGELGFKAGLGQPAASAQPIYLRDQVAHVKG